VAECTTDEFESLECWIVGGGFGEVIQNPPFSKGEKGRPPEIRLVVGRAKWGGLASPSLRNSRSEEGLAGLKPGAYTGLEVGRDCMAMATSEPIRITGKSWPTMASAMVRERANG
jgi:hypothetical protein